MPSNVEASNASGACSDRRLRPQRMSSRPAYNRSIFLVSARAPARSLLSETRAASACSPSIRPRRASAASSRMMMPAQTIRKSATRPSATQPSIWLDAMIPVTQSQSATDPKKTTIAKSKRQNHRVNADGPRVARAATVCMACPLGAATGSLTGGASAGLGPGLSSSSIRTGPSRRSFAVIANGLRSEIRWPGPGGYAAARRPVSG